MPWDKLVEKTQTALNRKQTPLKDKALMALYTLRPPRRNDYSELKVIRTKSNKVTAKTIANLDTKFNYLILDKSDKPKEFRFSRYKTEKKYGTQTFDVKNKELVDLLTRYIKAEKILNGDYVFVNSKDESYKKTCLKCTPART